MRIDQIELSGSLSISSSLATNPLTVNNNYLFVSNTGNVGIGTKTPTSKLVVTGSVSVQGSMVAKSLVGSLTGSVKLPTIAQGTSETNIVLVNESGGLVYRSNLSLTGAQGNQGPTGATGTVGTNGAQGNQGPTGATGTVGTNGAQGNQGPTGLQGTVGTNGTNGAQGNQGTQGTQGIQGTAGTNGTNGAQGNQGPTGLQGTVGTNGTNGAQGNQGPTGIQGTAGTNGTNGTNGAQGNQGPTGIQGTAGATGGTGGTGAQGAAGIISGVNKILFGSLPLTVQTGTVTFPSSFSSIPTVNVQLISTFNGPQFLFVNTITTTGFNYLSQYTGAAMNWIAIN